MKNIFLLLFFLSFFSNLIYAQKEGYVWYFGDSAGVDFNSGVPSALLNGSLNTIEGCATISDANGSLLFYSDGFYVWNRLHDQMPNGNWLAGGVSSTQSALIAPFPNNNTLCYIFTVQASGDSGNFSYSVVDMALDNGNGDVTVKNSLIVSGVSEKLTAVRHSNNIDFWVMVHAESSDSIFAYLVNSSGISLSPVISKIGTVFNTADASQGYMKFSPDGSKLAYAAFGANYVELFDFNSTTGSVTSLKHLNLPSAAYGVYGIEFSATGNYLYSSFVQPGNIYQWDITSGSEPIINSSIQLIGTSTAINAGALQLAPDGKIYVAQLYESHLGVISNPELPGAQCNYIDNAVSLGGRTCLTGLPNYIQSYFLPTGINEDNSHLSFSVFPNPFVNNISLVIPKQSLKQLTFTVKNTLGQTVLSKSENTVGSACTRTIDTGFLSCGIYFFELIIDGKRTVVKALKREK
ncbi:MAG: T9SS type A sorting domain-containing protein [Bacteroidetes bacterium]|nr:T9SS type A sorting domain-containing protein [Bacteroidota bacterium]